MDEIPNDEQITDEAGLLEHTQFIIEPVKQFSVGRCARTVPFAQTLITKLAQITLACFSRRNWILRIFGAPKFKLEMTTLADFESVRNRLRKIAEYFAHFHRRFEI